MRCNVCGAESGKYPLCRVCNIKKEKGEIIKCTDCGRWHYAAADCDQASDSDDLFQSEYLYDVKKRFISKSEQAYYTAIISALPEGCNAYPQVNLASFIVKNDNSPFHNELFRNVDFLVANELFEPLFIIEINDQTHLNRDRKERDEKVQKICEEAGIPIVKFWTSYGVNEEYIKKKMAETLDSLPIERVHHFSDDPEESVENEPLYVPREADYPRKAGCYVATCVYGSYDCPEVWLLRRFRDVKMASSWYGRVFIRIYYTVSPMLVRVFGGFKWFHKLTKPKLDKFVSKLREQGFEDTPYKDRQW